MPSVEVVNSTLVRHLVTWCNKHFCFSPIQNHSVRWWIIFDIAPPPSHPRISWSQESLDDVAFKSGTLQSGAMSCAGQPHNGVSRHTGVGIVTDHV